MGIVKKLTVGIMAIGILVGMTSDASATSYTYGQFSLMFEKSAGQYKDSYGNVAGQWAWSPESSTVSDIAWGNPATWPPATTEKFSISSDGKWVLMNGYTNSGTFTPQVVTSQWIGDANCNNMTTVQTNTEYYAQWNVPSTGYCLDAIGYMNYSGTIVNFEHRTAWSPPATCNNVYYGNQTCITQTEQWWDNNGNPGGSLTLKVNRAQQIALGLGMLFSDNDYLHNWQAYGWAYWLWG